MAYYVLVCILLRIGAIILAYNETTRIEWDSTMHSDNYNWCILADVANEVFRIQNRVNSEKMGLSGNLVVVVLVDYSLWKLSVKFLENMERTRQGTQFIYLQLGEDNSTIDRITYILEELMINDSIINTLALFADDQTQIIQLLKTVSVSTNLRWTSLVHLTEWILVTTSSGLLNTLQRQQLNLDYITLLIQSETGSISWTQKSRETDFSQATTHTLSSPSNLTCNARHTHRDDIFQNLRLHPLLYLKTQKSIMAGLKIPAAISAKNYKRISFKETLGTTTVYGGFTITLLNMMAAILGFTCHFVTVYDGGGYGEALSNGTITGITGLLGRREAGIAALVSRLQNRAQVIDFLPTILMEETANIVYRLPQASESLDLTYIKIIQSQFLLSLVGPVVLIAIIGAVVHVITRECTSRKPRKFSKRDLRSLRSFPSHIVFLNDYYAGQTGRILIGTWATFCLILWSAYSAYLVTTFATKPNELAINTFQQLVQHSEFKMGMLGTGNALAIIFKTSNDKWLHQIWNKVVEYNKTDPFTFSSDLADHVRKIVAGKYAFIDNFSLASGLFYDYLPSNQTYVRAYPQTSLQGTEASYVAIPKHVFYGDTLYKLHLDLEMAGIILKLQNVYFSNTNQPASKVKHEGNVIDFDRIEFLVYMVVAGIIASFGCLVGEFVYTRWQGRPNKEE